MADRTWTPRLTRISFGILVSPASPPLGLDLHPITTLDGHLMLRSTIIYIRPTSRGPWDSTSSGAKVCKAQHC
jgi:hypothetical protein